MRSMLSCAKSPSIAVFFRGGAPTPPLVLADSRFDISWRSGRAARVGSWRCSGRGAMVGCVNRVRGRCGVVAATPLPLPQSPGAGQGASVREQLYYLFFFNFVNSHKLTTLIHPLTCLVHRVHGAGPPGRNYTACSRTAASTRYRARCWRTAASTEYTAPLVPLRPP